MLFSVQIKSNKQIFYRVNFTGYPSNHFSGCRLNGRLSEEALSKFCLWWPWKWIQKISYVNLPLSLFARFFLNQFSRPTQTIICFSESIYMNLDWGGIHRFYTHCSALDESRQQCNNQIDMNLSNWFRSSYSAHACTIACMPSHTI